MTRGNLVFFLLLVSGVTVDLWSKSAAFELVPHSSARKEVIDDFFYIDRAENSGAMWSLGTGISRWVWVAVRGGVFIMILAFYLRTRPESLWAHVAFALVLAGALGNLYDNLFSPGGRVRDFLRFDFHFWWRDTPYVFPIFNVADSMICVGAPLLLLYFHRRERKPDAIGEAA